MIDLEKYNYHLPEELIRKQGVEPRDSARLFVYDTAQDKVTHARFSDLAQFLPEHSLMILNNTKVVPARLYLKKETGGKIEVFVLANEMKSVVPASPPERAVSVRAGEPESGSRITRPNVPFRYGQESGMTSADIPVLVDRKCLPGWKLYFPNGEYFEVVRQQENIFFVVLKSEKSLEEMLMLYGETPIPHYLEDVQKDENIMRNRYQTVFAHEGASVAAPTASLHFTENVFRSLDEKHIERAEVTLNVGLGTFAPLREEHFQTGKLHSETVSVSERTAERINEAKSKEQKVVAVGTTAMRTIESVAKHVISAKAEIQGNIVDSRVGGNDKTENQENTIGPFLGNTDIFIYPPYRFQIADALVTNFHLPKSSLMLLVDAFLEHKGAKRRIVELYEEAIREDYAFYSFGDSMLIL